MKHVLCSSGSGIDEKLRCVNRSWTPDSYFNLRKPIHRGESEGKCPGGMSGYRNKGRRFPVLSPGAEYPSYATGTPIAVSASSSNSHMVILTILEQNPHLLGKNRMNCACGSVILGLGIPALVAYRTLKIDTPSRDDVL